MFPRRLLIAVCLLPFLIIVAQARQSVPGSIVKCLDCTSSNSNAGSGARPAPQPSAAELQRQRLQAQAFALNAQGNAAFDRKDWAAAFNAYKAALEKTPGDVVIRRNLAGAQGWLAMDAYNRQDWKTALDVFREAVKNDPSNTVYPQWVAAAEKGYQAAAGEGARQQQEAVAAAQQQQQNQVAAAGVQQVMRDFAQTLDGTSDLTRVGSGSAAANAGKQGSSTPSGGDAGLTFMAPAAAAANAPVAGQPSGGAPSAAQTSQALPFMPPGEIHDAPTAGKTATPSAPAQGQAAAGGGGNELLQFMPPAVSTSTQAGNPPEPATVPFDQAAHAADGAAVNGLKFTPGGATRTATTQPAQAGNPPAAVLPAQAPAAQPPAAPTATGQAQPKPPTAQGGIAFETPDSSAVDLRGAQAPLALQPRNLKEPAPNPAPAPAAEAGQVVLPDDADLQFLFPPDPTPSSSSAGQAPDLQKILDDPQLKEYQFMEAWADIDKALGIWSTTDAQSKAEADAFLENWTHWTLYAIENNRTRELVDIRANSYAMATAYQQVQEREQAAIDGAHARKVAAIVGLMLALRGEGLYKPGASLAENLKNPRLVQAIRETDNNLTMRENQAIRDAEAEAQKELLDAGHQIITLGKPWSLPPQ